MTSMFSMASRRLGNFVRRVHIYYPHRGGPKVPTPASQTKLLENVLAADRDNLPHIDSADFVAEFDIGEDGKEVPLPWLDIVAHARGGSWRVYHHDHWYTATRLERHIRQLKALYRMRHSTVVKTHGKTKADEFVAEALDKIRFRYEPALAAKLETRREALHEIMDLSKDLRQRMWDLDGTLPDPTKKRRKMSKPEKLLTKEYHKENKKRLAKLRDHIANRPPPQD